MSCNEECGCQDTCFVVTTHTSSYLHTLYTLYKSRHVIILKMMIVICSEAALATDAAAA